MPPSHAPEWVKDAVFYQIFPERFANGDPSNDPPGSLPWGSPPDRENFMGGDLQGILDHLDYLHALGVTALYLTPIFQARSNHKYDTSDYLQIDPAFGSRALLKELVAQAHRRGLRVVLDAVFNHAGDSFWAFEDLRQKGPDSAYRDWFFPAAFPIRSEPPNYQTCGGASFLPKLNLENPSLRAHLLEVSRFWMEEAGIDGWRLDVPWKAPMDFWQEFRTVVKGTNPDAYIVAETWRDCEHWLQGDTADGVMNYPLRDYLLDYCLRDAMDAEDVDIFIRRQNSRFGEAAPYQLNLLGSHDTPRLLTLAQGNARRAVLAATMLFTQVGTPMVYYGDETGMEGENDPGCRGCMNWDPAAWDPTVAAAYQQLIHLRREHPALRSGLYEPLLTFNGVYAYRRRTGADEVIVVTNPRQAQDGIAIPLPPGTPASPAYRDLFTGTIYPTEAAAMKLGRLEAQAALVLLPQDGMIE